MRLYTNYDEPSYTLKEDGMGFQDRWIDAHLVENENKLCLWVWVETDDEFERFWTNVLKAEDVKVPIGIDMNCNGIRIFGRYKVYLTSDGLDEESYYWYKMGRFEKPEYVELCIELN